MYYRSGVKPSFICRNLLGAMGLGMVAGGSAGCCMGVMAAEMAHLIKDGTLSQINLTKHLQLDLKTVLENGQVFIYFCLLVATLSSVIGVIGGVQAYKLARIWNQADASGKAFTLAAPVAVLGVAVTGASLGAVLVIYFSRLFSIVFFLGQCLLFVPPLIFSIFREAHNFPAALYFGGIVYLEYICSKLFLSTQLAIFADLATMVPLISLTFLFAVLDKRYKLQFSRITVKVPAIVITTVLIARSLLRDEHQPMPLLDPAEAALLVLERFFITVFSVQMFQASFWAVLYSYVVTSGEGKVCASAVAAAVGVLAVLQKASPILGTEASLGGLLAVSGVAGVALTAAGDLGQRYGGHVGRAGAVVGAAVGAFLTLAAQDVKFALMVALCAAAFPGSAFVVVGLDSVWKVLFSYPWFWYLCFFLGVEVVCILAYMDPVFRIVVLIRIFVFFYMQY